MKKKTSTAKQIAQTSILGILLLGVALVFISSPRGQRLLGGSPDNLSGWSIWGTTESEEDGSSDADDDPDMYVELEDDLSLPACQDVRDALQNLDQARCRLLTVATSGDQEELEAAGSDYRTRIQELKDSFTRLRSFVEPDAYQTLLDQLVSSREASEEWSTEDFLPEWQLGLLKRENSR